MSDLHEKLGAAAGKTASVDASPPVRFRWPTAKRDQYEYLESWHAVAMQIAGKKTSALRVLAVLPIAFRRDAGVLRETDERLAERAGCSEKTISRGIQILKAAGLLVAEKKPRRIDDRTVTDRACFLSFPARLHEGVFIPDFDECVMDTRCPSRPGSVMDTRCPEHSDSVTDTRCPDGMDTRCPSSPVPEYKTQNRRDETHSSTADPTWRDPVPGGGGPEAPATPNHHREQELAKSQFRDEFGELDEDLEHQAMMLFEKGVGVQEIIDRIRFKLIVRDIANAG